MMYYKYCRGWVSKVYPDMAIEKFIQIHVNRTNANLLLKTVQRKIEYC